MSCLHFISSFCKLSFFVFGALLERLRRWIASIWIAKLEVLMCLMQLVFELGFGHLGGFGGFSCSWIGSWLLREGVLRIAFWMMWNWQRSCIVVYVCVCVAIPRQEQWIINPKLTVGIRLMEKEKVSGWHLETIEWSLAQWPFGQWCLKKVFSQHHCVLERDEALWSSCLFLITESILYYVYVIWETSCKGEYGLRSHGWPVIPSIMTGTRSCWVKSCSAELNSYEHYQSCWVLYWAWSAKRRLAVWYWSAA